MKFFPPFCSNPANNQSLSSPLILAYDANRFLLAQFHYFRFIKYVDASLHWNYLKIIPRFFDISCFIVVLLYQYSFNSYFVFLDIMLSNLYKKTVLHILKIKN